MPANPTGHADNEPADEAVRLHERVEDMRDLHQARMHAAVQARKQPLWRKLGPGVITGAADDDPSGIGTYSVAGAQFGLALMWLVPFLVPLMIAVQEMCGRVAAVTGVGLAAVVKKHYSKWVLWGAVVLLAGANTINVYADLNAMAASANMVMGGLTVSTWLLVITVFTVCAQIVIPYRVYVRFLKYMALALFAYVAVAFMPKAHVHWGAVLAALVRPHWQMSAAFIMTVVGFIGTTISPYLFFWQAGETVEEEIAEGKTRTPGVRITRATDEEMRAVRTDTIIGMGFSQLITLFIMVCTASTIFASNRGAEIGTAQDAANALAPIGPAAPWLFTIGILGTGLLAIPTLAGSVGYAMAETFGWKYGLFRRFTRARAFYATICGVILVGYGLNFVRSIQPIKGLLYSAVLNGLVAPPLIILLLLICRNRAIMKDRINGPWSNILGWITVVLMTAAGAYMIYGIATGKA